MKKTKYYYVSSPVEYEIGAFAYLRKNDIQNFYDQTGVKLYVESRRIGNKLAEMGFTWEFVEDDKLPQYFQFVESKEVDVKETVTKLPKDDRFPNGYNWKNAHIYGANARLRKPNPNADPYNPSGKPPINPRTGLRDGKA